MLRPLLSRCLSDLHGAVAAFVQPKCFLKYHYALKPRMVKPGEEISDNEARLYKPVAPADKWEHTGSNFDPLVMRITGMITIRGEREVARDVMRRTFREIKLLQLNQLRNSGQLGEMNALPSPFEVIHKAVENCKPVVLLQSVVRGGTLYQVPSPPASDSVATHMAIRFLVDSAKTKPVDTRFWKSFAKELLAASEQQGKAYRRKIELHKKCEENRAYANYRTY